MPVSLAASPWGSGSLRESSAVPAERESSFAYNNLSVKSSGKLCDWIRARQARGKEQESRRFEEKRKEGPSQAKETEQRAGENETRGKKIESSDS